MKLRFECAKQVKVIGLLALVLAIGVSCSSTPVYKPAKGQKQGYSETALSESRYRVKFRLYGKDVSQAQEYSLLRASELTLLQGYDWFEVVDRFTDIDRNERDGGVEISKEFSRPTNCGLLGCARTTSSQTSISSRISHDSARDTIMTVLEIQMGKGTKPEGKHVYSAQELASKLRPQLVKE